MDNRFIPIKIINPQNDKEILVSAMIDTGADSSCIPKEIVDILELRPISMSKIATAAGTLQVENYFVKFEINNKSIKTQVTGISNPIPVLLGWDIISSNINAFPNFIQSVFQETISLLEIIPKIKQNTVLILGQDTTEIERLRKIKDILKNSGYESLIVKEITDIEIQSTEEKVNMLASLSRFILCDNTFPSGHIDELKICAMNRFTTAIIQEEGKGATWMQADYDVDYNYIKTFTYKDFSNIKNAVDKAIKWAENRIQIRKTYFNNLYKWRK